MFAALAVPAHAFAEVSEDGRVEKALTELGYNYSVPPSGGPTQVNITLKNGRTQQVFVVTSPSSVGNSSFRDVFAYSYQNKKPLSDDLVAQLLEVNATSTIGAWSLSKDDRKFFGLTFTVPIPADANNSMIGTVIDAVANQADQMELALTGKDWE